MKILKKGIKGEEVIQLQSFLKEKKLYFFKIDGDFGPKTHSSVVDYQTRKGLKGDGIVGNNTYAILKLDGFKLTNENESLDSIEDSDILNIIDKNSHKLVAEPNKYNSKTTSFDPEKNIIVVAIRGFKLNSMGKRGENDRKIYDDAHFIVSPRGVIAFEANTDPNGYRKGSGYGSNKGMAMLDEGIWFYNKGPHRGRPSFRQACPFTVVRDGNPPYKHTGWHAINWHSGGMTTTSSLGCQTNKPNDFELIRDFLYKELETFDNPKMCNDWSITDRAFPYILVSKNDI